MARKFKEPTWKFPKRVYKFFLFFLCLLFITYLYLALSPTIFNTNMDEFSANRNTVSKVLEAQRGTIYDIESNVLATNVVSYTVIAYLDKKRTTNAKKPEHVVDKEMTAKALAPILNMTEEELLNLLSKDAYQVELGPGGRDINEIKKREIEDLSLPGISFTEKFKRYYPNGDFASYIIGYAKTNESVEGESTEYSINGELGIEAKFNDSLKGTDGYLEYQRDRYGYKIPDTKETRIEAIDGKDIYLTIDANIQRFVETSVKNIQEKYEPEWAQITIMDAKTGDILASSQSPSYNPNLRNLTNYENALVTNAYEPGSTMKIYTYMCALEKGTYKGDETFKSGSINIEDATIKDWNKYGWGTITYDKGFEYSSNVGVSNMLQKFIDKNDLRDCLEKYGFGSLTKIDLDREVTGTINFKYPVEVASAGFGQGITVTGIQQLRALSMIANDGKALTPHVVYKVVDPNNNKTKYKRKIETSEKLVSDSTIKKIKELMNNVVNSDDPGATGKLYKIDGYNIIGKTGTAQISSGSKGYLTGWNDYIYSFAGMYPNEEPEIIIYAAVKKPNVGATYTVADATVELFKNIAKYRNMFQGTNNNGELDSLVLASYTNKSTSDVQLSLNSKNINTIILGDGEKIINQYPKKGKTVVSYDKVFLLTNAKELKMPSLANYTRNEVISILNLLNLDYEIDGYGKVDSQSIASGTIIKVNDKIKVTLKNE